MVRLWQLEDDDEKDESKPPRYVASKRQDKTHVNVKVPSHLVRYIDEYVASRSDPYCRTRSDAINDAILAWVWRHKEMSESSSELDMMFSQVELATMSRQAEHIAEIVEGYEQLVNAFVTNRDWRGLTNLLPKLIKVRKTFMNRAGEAHIEAINRLIDRVQGLVSKG